VILCFCRFPCLSLSTHSHTLHFFSVTRHCDCAGKVFLSDNFSLFPPYAEEQRGRPFRRLCDVILWDLLGPDGVENRNENEVVEEGEDEAVNLLEAVTDLVLERDDMPVDMPVHQPPRFPLPDEARHGPISIRGSQTRFDLDWEYVPGEAPVPLQNAVNELREFDEAGRHFRVTLDGVNLRQGVGGNAGRRWTVRDSHNRAGPPNAYFGMDDMNQAGVTGQILVEAVDELNEQLEAAAEFHGRAGPVVRITTGSVKVFTQRYWAQQYHRDDQFFQNHRDSIERGEGIIGLNFGGVSTLKFKHGQRRPMDDWEFELDREYLGYTYMSPCARLLCHAVTYADGELAAQQRELEEEQQEQEQEQEQQEQQQPEQQQQQQPQQPQQQQQGADAVGGVEDEDDENARGVSVVYLFKVSVREGYWRDKGPEWHATFNRAIVAFLVSFWLDRQLQRPQGGGGGEDDDGGGGGGGGDDGNQPQQVQPPGAGGEDAGGENDDNDGLVPLNQLPRNPFNPPSEEDIRNLLRAFGHNQHQVIEPMSKSQRLQRLSEQHQARFNKARAVKRENEETCSTCCTNKDRLTAFRDGNKQCIACLDQNQQWHQARFNKAHAVKRENEETCTNCCKNKDRQTCFRKGNTMCIECLDQNQQWHQARFNDARAVKRENEETCTKCCTNKDRQTCFRKGNTWCNACLDKREQTHQEKFNKAHAVKLESQETCTKCCTNKDRQICFRDGNVWCNACLDAREQSNQERFNKAHAVKLESQETCTQCYTNKDRQICFRNGNSRCNACLDVTFNNARATKEESEETCTRCCTNKDRQTCFRNGNALCIACLDTNQQKHQEKINKARATKEESEETCTQCCTNKDRLTAFRNGNALCIACLDTNQQRHQERINKARATKEESEETCTRCGESKDRQTFFRKGNASCNACLDKMKERKKMRSTQAVLEGKLRCAGRCGKIKDMSAFDGTHKTCKDCLEKQRRDRAQTSSAKKKKARTK